MTPIRFTELGLSPELIKAIDKLGFEQASPIQAASIPILLSGKDIVGQSQTGSGKTAAFAIPAIEKTEPNLRAVQILILCPTRELAVQVSEEIHKLCLFKRGITALPIYGGQSYERQFMGLKQGAQIVIGTPGRLMDHMRRGTLRLDKVKMAILDEADVMLNMGFRDDIETILKAVPPARQTVFFSATMSAPIRELIEKYSREPQNVKMEQQAMTVPTVEQVYYEVDRRYKIDLLTRLIDIHDLKLGIIFCNTKRMVDDLADHLTAQGYIADRLHGDMSQGMRDRVMNKFRKSGLEFLVATDIAARGIDVDDVQVVFNYDLPYDPEDYVHRIGRTGRAGRSGRAISFVAGREVFQIQVIERYMKTRMKRAKIPTADEVEEARSNVLIEKLRATLTAGNFPKQDRLIERLLEEGFTSTDIASACLAQWQTNDAPKPQPEREESSNRRDSYDDRTPRHERMRDDRRPERRNDRPMERRPDPVRPPAPRPVPAVIKPAVQAGPKGEAKVVEPVIPTKPVVVEAEVKVIPPPPAPAVIAPKKEYPFEKKAPPAKAPADKPKASRATPSDFTRLYLNLGFEHQITSDDIKNSILGETGLPAASVGVIDMRERHSFIDVAAASANAVIAKLNRAQIKSKRAKIKLA